MITGKESLSEMMHKIVEAAEEMERTMIDWMSLDEDHPLIDRLKDIKEYAGYSQAKYGIRVERFSKKSRKP